MKTLLASLLIAAAASPALAGPDFVSKTPRPQEHAASNGTAQIDPVDDVVFTHNSEALIPSAISQIDRAAQWLKANPRHRIVLEGYASSLGAQVYNEDLATRRADLVRNHLIGQGISSDRIVLVIYGETGARPGGFPLDRRVVMWATEQPVAAIIDASEQRRNALSAIWTERGRLFVDRPAARAKRPVQTATR